MNDDSAQPASDGRDEAGRFTSANPFRFQPGNQARRGRRNPRVGHANRLRARFAAELTERKVALIVNALVKRALKGDARCAELLLRYAVGPATDPVLLDRLDRLEENAGIARIAPNDGDDEDEQLPTPLIDIFVGEDGTYRIARVADGGAA